MLNFPGLRGTLCIVEDLWCSPCAYSLPQDYPSVGQVAQALSAANIQPIFAVTSATLPVYQVRAV